MATHYQLLNVAPDADRSAIRAAYKALIKQHHPDAKGGDAEMATRLNEAYRALSDTKRREAYDRGLAAEAAHRARAHRPPPYAPGPRFDYFHPGMATAGADDARSATIHGMEPGRDGYLGQANKRRNGLLFLAILCAVAPFALVLWKKSQAPQPPADGSPVIAPAPPQSGGSNAGSDSRFVGGERPPTGQMSGAERPERVAPFEVSVPAGADYVVKLVDEATGEATATLYVRGGERLATSVPLGRYRLRSAWGTQWLGPAALFGPPTRYAEANQVYDFGFEGGRIRGYTVALVPQEGANRQGRTIRREQF